MRVFVAGATGYIGSAVARSLKARGHQVIGSARNDAAVEKLKAAGVEPIKADLADAPSFGRAARDADAIIQTASTADMNSPKYEPAAAHAVLEAIAGTNKPFILTSGVWVYGKTGGATEASPLNPFMMVAWRPAIEDAVLKAPKIRGVVVRPGIVYGRGGGIPAMFVGGAKQHKRIAIPGDGTSRWSTVHVDDLGELYALALEKAPPGALYNGTSGEVIRTEEIGRALSKRLGVEFALWPLEEARKTMGPFADALALDQVVTSPNALALGWKPSHPSLADELATGSYG